MATHAARPRTRARSRTPSALPWWKRILPSAAIVAALVTAGPQWIEQIQRFAQNIHLPIPQAKDQALLWRKNIDCTLAPATWIDKPNHMKMATIVCDSGDVFVRAIAPDNREHFKWLALDDIIPRSDRAGGLVSTAHAATLEQRIPPARPAVRPAMVALAQPQAPQGKVICHRFIDDRHVLRRLQTAQGCIDQVIDMYNGTVVSTKPAPCTPQC